MSNESKSHRPLSEIQAEYQSNCTKLGHLEYQIFTLGKDVSLIQEVLRELNFEAAASHTAEQKAKEAEAK